MEPGAGAQELEARSWRAVRQWRPCQKLIPSRFPVREEEVPDVR